MKIWDPYAVAVRGGYDPMLAAREMMQEAWGLPKLLNRGKPQGAVPPVPDEVQRLSNAANDSGIAHSVEYDHVAGEHVVKDMSGRVMGEGDIIAARARASGVKPTSSPSKTASLQPGKTGTGTHLKVVGGQDVANQKTDKLPPPKSKEPTTKVEKPSPAALQQAQQSAQWKAQQKQTNAQAQSTLASQIQQRAAATQPQAAPLPAPVPTVQHVIAPPASSAPPAPASPSSAPVSSAPNTASPAPASGLSSGHLAAAGVAGAGLLAGGAYLLGRHRAQQQQHVMAQQQAGMYYPHAQQGYPPHY